VNAVPDGGSLFVGYSATATGTYSLSGTGTLTAGSEYIGYTGTGTFTQGGTSENDIHSTLQVGQPALDGSFNSNLDKYELDGGVLNAGEEIIGNGNQSAFVQTGGANTITGDLQIGLQTGSTSGQGSYELDTSAALSAQNEYIGDGGLGNFTQYGGDNHVSGTLWVGTGDDGGARIL
jgi:hypothetical protein